MPRLAPVAALPLLLCAGCSASPSSPAPQDARPKAEVIDAAQAGSEPAGIVAAEGAVAVDPPSGDSSASKGPPGVDPAKSEPLPEQPASGAPKSRPLLVATGSGLVEFDLDGARLRSRTTSAAQWPRELPDGSVLYVHQHPGELAIMTLNQANEERELARIPARIDSDACKLVPQTPGAPTNAAPSVLDVAIQEDWGFLVDTETKSACVRLADGSPHMMIEATVRVDLSSGATTSVLSYDELEHCTVVEAAHCSGRLSPKKDPHADAAKLGEWAWQWDEEQALLYPTGAPKDPRAQRICAVTDPSGHDGENACASLEGRSGSGRFLLLSGPTSEGDYVHRELFLVDLRSAAILGILGEAHTLEVVPVDRVTTEGSGSIDVVGESDVRWVGDGTLDRLWIDGLLIDPVSRRVTMLDGQLARTL